MPRRPRPTLIAWSRSTTRLGSTLTSSAKHSDDPSPTCSCCGRTCRRWRSNGSCDLPVGRRACRRRGLGLCRRPRQRICRHRRPDRVAADRRGPGGPVRDAGPCDATGHPAHPRPDLLWRRDGFWLCGSRGPAGDQPARRRRRRRAAGIQLGRAVARGRDLRHRPDRRPSGRAGPRTAASHPRTAPAAPPGRRGRGRGLPTGWGTHLHQRPRPGPDRSERLRRADPSIRVSNQIRPGNSGGPLLDAQARVVGVVFAVDTRTGDGLAIPVDALEHTARRAGFFENASPC